MSVAWHPKHCTCYAWTYLERRKMGKKEGPMMLGEGIQISPQLDSGSPPIPLQHCHFCQPCSRRGLEMADVSSWSPPSFLPLLPALLMQWQWGWQWTEWQWGILLFPLIVPLPPQPCSQGSDGSHSSPIQPGAHLLPCTTPSKGQPRHGLAS